MSTNNFDESNVRRQAAGTSKGGQFAPSEYPSDDSVDLDAAGTKSGSPTTFTAEELYATFDMAGLNYDDDDEFVYLGTQGFHLDKDLVENEDVKGVVDRLREWDMDEQLEDLGSSVSYADVEGVRDDDANIDRLIDQLQGRAYSAKSDDDLDFGFSGLDDAPGPDEPASEANLDKFLMEASELDYGNAEAWEDDHNVWMTVEAPNHSTMGISVEKGSPMSRVYAQLRIFGDDFSAEDEFDELWSPEFGQHNGYTPTQFAQMLDEDEEFYSQLGDELRSRGW